MSDNIQDAIKDIIEGGADVPDRVTNRLLLAAIIHNSDQTEITNARAEETNTLIREQNSRISKLEDHPSLIYLLRQWPRQTIIALIIAVTIIFRLWNALPPLIELISVLVGIPLP